MDTLFPRGEKNEAFKEYFVGQSYLNMLTTTGVAIGNVTFEPGCRNNWHIHHKGAKQWQLDHGIAEPPVSTVFFGGGTPTILAARDLVAI